MRTRLVQLTGALVTLLACVQGGVVQAAAPLTLVRDGQAAAVIVLGAEATKAARFGAAELQWHVKQMTGAELPIVREGEPRPAWAVSVYIGDTARTREIGLPQSAFSNQEFIVKVVGEELFLVGKDKPDTGEMKLVHDLDKLTENKGWPTLFDEQGSLYAVYEFLQKACGVRWLNPYPTGTVLSHAPTLTAQVVEVRYAPDFVGREGSWFRWDGRVHGGPKSYIHHSGLVKPGSPAYTAYERLAFQDLARLYALDDPAKAKAQEAAYDGAKHLLISLFLRRLRLGGEQRVCNHSLYSYYERFREATWTEYLANAKTPAQTAYYTKRKADVFEADHPDWFAQGYGPGKPPQLCYTNPEVIRQVAQDARDYYDGKKTGAQLGIGFAEPPSTFPVEPMDNGSYCKCERCLQIPRIPHTFYSSRAHSDYWFHFVNEVATELHKTHPNARLKTLAYMTHAGKPSFPLEPNVEVQFCAVNADEPSTPVNPWFNAEHELFLEWGEEVKQSGRVFGMWTYTGSGKEGYEAGAGNYVYPDYIAHNLAEQVKLWREFGVQSIFHCGRYPEPDQYMMWRLLFDRQQDAEALLQEYFTGLYGAAGVPLKAMYDDIEHRRYHHFPGGGKPFADSYWTDWGTAERMEAWGKLMAEARGLAKTEREKRNVTIFEAGPWAFLQEARKSEVERESSRVVKAGSFLSVPCLAVLGLAPAGDLSKVDWRDAQGFGSDNCWLRDSGAFSLRQITSSMIHDGGHLYLRFAENNLARKPGAGDNWEVVFFDRKAGRAYRLFIDPAGVVKGQTYGEGVPQEWADHGATATSRVLADRWEVALAVPARDALLDAQGRLLMNCRRNDASGEDTAVLVATGNAFEAGQTGALVSFDQLLPAVGAAPAGQDLIVDYDFQGTEDQVEDRSGEGNDGTLFGGVERSERGLLFNSGYYQYVELPSLARYDFGSFTVSCWVNVKGSKGPRATGARNLFSFGTFGPAVWVPTNRIGIGWQKADGRATSASPVSFEITPAVWNLIVMTCDNLQWKVYVNGRERMSFRAEGLAPPGPDTMWRIAGGPKSPPWYSFIGTYGRFQIYKRTLAAEEVLAKYAAEYPSYRLLDDQPPPA